MLKRFLLAALMAGTAMSGLPAAQAAYPEKPITMIVAYGAGGSTDVTARMLVPYIEAQLGNGAKIIVLNKAGAGGELGFAAIAQAAPDGYTIGFINTPNVVTIPIERKARYALTDFDPLVNTVDDPGSMTVHADSSIKSPADLVAQAKAGDAKVTVGSTGVGSDDHLAMLLLQRQAKVKFIHAPFPGGADSHRAMLGKHIVTVAQNLGEGLRAKAGGDAIRMLGVMSDKRSELAPDLPTFKEQGFDITMAAMRGIAAPKGLPPDIRAKLVEAITKAANDPEFKAKATSTYQPLRLLGPDAFKKELGDMDAYFRTLWAETPWL